MRRLLLPATVLFAAVLWMLVSLEQTVPSEQGPRAESFVVRDMDTGHCVRVTINPSLSHAVVVACPLSPDLNR